MPKDTTISVSEIGQQFDDAQKLFDEHIQSHQVMCRIAHAFSGQGWASPELCASLNERIWG
jgi:hypothetical protein